MKLQTRLIWFAAVLTAVCGAAVPEIQWKPGDHNRPQPAKVTPAVASTPDKPGSAPSDAVALFDGKDLSAWKQSNGKPMSWKLGNGYFEAAPGSGDVVTTQSFGDAQVHVEWVSPDPPKGTDQEPGNSGIYLMSHYEIQVLESFHNVTYPDGMAGSVYCQYPPQVNASLAPGKWQTYDIIWHGPRFSASGELQRPATVTLIYNGVLVQDHVTLTGPTDWLKRPPYKAHPEQMPLLLQDHGQPVRYRNVWIRELKEELH